MHKQSDAQAYANRRRFVNRLRSTYRLKNLSPVLGYSWLGQTSFFPYEKCCVIVVNGAMEKMILSESDLRIRQY